VLSFSAFVRGNGYVLTFQSCKSSPVICYWSQLCYNLDNWRVQYAGYAQGEVSYPMIVILFRVVELQRYFRKSLQKVFWQYKYETRR